MNRTKIVVSLLFLWSSVLCNAATPGRSVYQNKLEDKDAVYFSPEFFKIKADGTTDVSEELQSAINQVKTRFNFGILFIPEGSYLISKTIYIPTAVRLIGYGKHRPLIILKRNSPGFHTPDPAGGNSPYMFWFTSTIVRPGEPVHDANASTFYSALSNIDLRIDEGNPDAIALRTHFAQHSFVSHCDIHIGQGKAGIYDVGNEIEDVRFFGGAYGIITNKPSPGWPFLMIDTYFEEQRNAAIRTQEAGLTIIRMRVKNVPVVISIDSNRYEKLYMENCMFEKISQAAIEVGKDGTALNQINLQHIDCRNVPLFMDFRQNKRQIKGRGTLYRVQLSLGLHQEFGQEASFMENVDMKPIDRFEEMPVDIPDLPEGPAWINLKTLGAAGDGRTDDTKAIQHAIDTYDVIYVPQGWYKVSETLKLRPETKLIGLSPIATQFVLPDNTAGFGGFGRPIPLLEVPHGGHNLVTGIGINTGLYNSRAVGCKWMAGKNSFLNDMKFIGGHGTMERPSLSMESKNPLNSRKMEDPIIQQGKDESWDSQYWSLWITNGGGGTFKDIWSANTSSNAGVYISNTSTEAHVYALSVEHHVRNEVVFDRVSNWKLYALQTEEENREGSYAQPIEMLSCRNIQFANLYLYRVTRVNIPYPYAIRMWNCQDLRFLNVHNFSQTRFTATDLAFDVNSNRAIRNWELASLSLKRPDTIQTPGGRSSSGPEWLASGFEFATGLCADRKGNLYFCESRLKRIYKWSSSENKLSLLSDLPWEPLALAVDQHDSLLVLFKYFRRKEYPAAGTTLVGWGYTGFEPLMYSVNPDKPQESMHLLSVINMDSLPHSMHLLYPGNRATNFYTTESKAGRPGKAFLAQDGLTVIPAVSDLFRANSFQEFLPSDTSYVVDEYNKQTDRVRIGADGQLSGLKLFAPRGEYSLAVDRRGHVFIADGEIYEFDPQGKELGVIHVPERPVNLIFGGKDGKTLFFTSRSAFYSLHLKN